NVLQNYDEFAALKALQDLEMNDSKAVEEFKAKHYLNDEDLEEREKERLNLKGLSDKEVKNILDAQWRRRVELFAGSFVPPPLLAILIKHSVWAENVRRGLRFPLM
ncbi:MAG TPA: hypothetical protein EYP68_01635, partial [Candidatus Korarchaeota archaeon]|nr:hypothetical protein [Candidatus Korarchaeota archaeon]